MPDILEGRCGRGSNDANEHNEDVFQPVSGVDRLIYSLPPSPSFLYSNVTCYLHIGDDSQERISNKSKRRPHAANYTTNI